MWLVLSFLLASAGAAHIDYLSTGDQESLVRVFESALSKPKDVVSLSFGVAGLKLLGKDIPNEESYCAYVKQNMQKDNIESVYAGVDIARRLQACRFENTIALEDFLKAGVTDDQTSQNLYYIIAGLKFLKSNVNKDQFLKALSAAVKRDDSVQSLAYAFHAAARSAGDLKPFMDRIEDVVAQADEVDNTFLQYEGGLSITANAVSGMYVLGDKNNKTAPMKPEQALKFANYLLSRKSVQLPRPAYHLVRALQFMNKNKHQMPVSITLDSGIALHAGHPHVVVKVTSILNEPLPGIQSVIAATATHERSQGVVLSKAPLTAVPNSNGLYRLDFLQEDRVEGFYTIAIDVTAGDKRLIGTHGDVRVKVMADVAAQNVEISVTDRDQKSTSNALNVQYPNKLSTVVDADYHQKLLMKFSLRNKKTQSAMRVQQAFVLFRNIETQQEVIFVAEPDANDVYKFDIDLMKKASDFDYLSGKYNMILIVGDAVLSNSFQWNLVDVNLEFPPHERSESAKTVTYKPKPTIKHMFREPEKRPSRAISNAFTLLVLAPLGLMLICWLVIGFNLSNFLCSIYTLAFHVGLAGIFGLYFMFWVKLNMFQTIRYLALVGGFTFITGNAMLRRMAERRMEKKKTQ